MTRDDGGSYPNHINEPDLITCACVCFPRTTTAEDAGVFWPWLVMRRRERFVLRHQQLGDEQQHKKKKKETPVFDLQQENPLSVLFTWNDFLLSLIIAVDQRASERNGFRRTSSHSSRKETHYVTKRTQTGSQRFQARLVIVFLSYNPQTTLAYSTEQINFKEH